MVVAIVVNSFEFLSLVVEGFLVKVPEKPRQLIITVHALQNEVGFPASFCNGVKAVNCQGTRNNLDNREIHTGCIFCTGSPLAFSVQRCGEPFRTGS